jgi:hypothetical protein
MNHRWQDKAEWHSIVAWQRLAEIIAKCYADAVDVQFRQICSGSTLPSQSVRQLVESGFVAAPGPLSGDPLRELTAAYDEVMAVAAGPDFKIASTTTRMSDLLTTRLCLTTSISIHVSLRLAATLSKNHSNLVHFWLELSEGERPHKNCTRT